MGVQGVDCSTSVGRDGTVLLTSTETKIGNCPVKLSALMLVSRRVTGAAG